MFQTWDRVILEYMYVFSSKDGEGLSNTEMIQFAYSLQIQFELRRSAETVTNNGYSGPNGTQLQWNSPDYQTIWCTYCYINDYFS